MSLATKPLLEHLEIVLKKTICAIYTTISKVISNKITGNKGFKRIILQTLAVLGLCRMTPDGLILVEWVGNKIYVDPEAEGISYILTQPEPETTRIFCNKLKKGDVVLDIGANVGYFSLIAANIVGDKGKVFAFECNPDSFNLLEKNIAINNYKNIISVKKAVSNYSGTSKLFLSRWGGACSLKEVADNDKVLKDGQDHILVETITLDEFFAGNNIPINFIKMDIEGSEPQALQGMEKLIESTAHLIIIMELHSKFIFNLNNPQEILENIRTKGFQLWVIDDQLKKFYQASPNEIVNLLRDKNCINLLCES